MDASPRARNHWFFLPAALALATLSGACSPSPDFFRLQRAALVGGDPGGTHDQEPTGSTRLVQDTFPVTVGTGALDMIWVIDNSGSMGEEAANVRTNMGRFATEFLATVPNGKVALLSDAGTSGTKVTLDPSLINAGGRQVDLYIDSHNALAALAVALCPANSTHTAAIATNRYRICNQELQFQAGIDFERATEVLSKRGSLHDFLRPGTPQAFVVVTDDNAKGVTAANFNSLLTSGGVNAATTLAYTFQGKSDSTCTDYAAIGASYLLWTAATGGLSFDICATNWTPSFDRIVSGAGAVSGGRYTLSDPDVVAGTLQVVAITGSGGRVILLDSDWVLSGGHVSVNPARLPAGAVSVEINYRAT